MVYDGVGINSPSNQTGDQEMTHADHPFRLHELDYRDELDSIRTSLHYLESGMEHPELRSLVAPTVKKLEDKEWLIEQVLQLPSLPPLPDSLRNPLHNLSPLEAELVKEATQMVVRALQES